MPQTNILLIHSDQHRWDSLGCHGHSQLHTPHLDRLATEGIDCSLAFTPSAICSPARASLLTGAWPHQHRCLSIPSAESYRPARAELPTLGTLLKNQGYTCGWVGKFHQEVAGTPGDHGFDSFISRQGYGAWRSEQGLPPKPRENGWFGEVDVGTTAEQSGLAWETDRVLELLHAADNNPFFIRWDPIEPHLPCRPPADIAAAYRPEDTEAWGSFADSLLGKPYIQRQQKLTWDVDGWDWDRWAPTVANYLAEIHTLDLQVGRLLQYLDDAGLTDNTLVIYSTDHGDLCGGHGMMDKHFVMYDDVMRVPLIARWPGQLPTNTCIDAFVNNELDIARTILAAAEIDAPDSFVGKDLRRIADGSDPEPRTDMYGSWSGGQFSLYSQRMLRDRRFKYIWNGCDVDELYDLEKDPFELTNVVADPAYRRVLHERRQTLVTRMDELQDPQLNPWTRDQLLSGRIAEA